MERERESKRRERVRDTWWLERWGVYIYGRMIDMELFASMYVLRARGARVSVHYKCRIVSRV